MIEIERRGHETGWPWAPTAHGTAAPNGSFSAIWPANHIGRFQIRAVIEGRGGSSAHAARRLAAGDRHRLPAVDRDLVRPGSWGSKTACGETLKKTTLGVANRTLPCGMPVAVYYRGKTMTVPVIDRGPYANHADWDLTAAAARALGMYSAGVATIGAVSLPRSSARTPRRRLHRRPAQSSPNPRRRLHRGPAQSGPNLVGAASLPRNRARTNLAAPPRSGAIAPGRTSSADDSGPGPAGGIRLIRDLHPAGGRREHGLLGCLDQPVPVTAVLAEHREPS